MRPNLLTIGQAARLLGLSPRTLLRAAQEGRISFRKTPANRRIIERAALYQAPVLTLGRAASYLGVHYETLLRAARRTDLATAPGRRTIGGYLSKNALHVAWAEAYRWAKQRGLIRRPRLRTKSHTGLRGELRWPK